MSLLPTRSSSSSRTWLRYASHNARNNGFPFPEIQSPTPHQIFHLPKGASQQDIKSRYYELVKIHHPDSPNPNSNKLTPAQRHARFQAITAAYESLKRPSLGGGFRPFTGTSSEEMDAIHAEIERRKRMYQNRHNRHAEYTSSKNYRYDWNSNPDERWKDQYIVGFGVILLLTGLAPNIFLYPFKAEQRHREAMRNLAKAREEAKEFGESRRLGIKEAAERVKKGE